VAPWTASGSWNQLKQGSDDRAATAAGALQDNSGAAQDAASPFCYCQRHPRGGTMRRREFIRLVGGAAAWPLAARAQQPGTAYRLGFLRNGSPPRTFIEGLRQGLRDLGYVESKNITIDYSLAASADDLPVAAAELVRRDVDLIIASGTPPTVAAKNATSRIPIIFVASIDPVAANVVTSLARPGGNITGFAGIHADLMGKRLELLKELVPGLSRVAVLAHAMNPGNVEYLRQAELAASALGLKLKLVIIHAASEFELAFGELEGTDALIPLDDVVFTSHRGRLVELAANKRLPVVYGFREFVESGGLMAYGADLPDQYRRAATYIDKILRGAHPADLPVQQPTKLELVINLKAATALGLEVPPTLLARADEVIE
jgi:putative ABC transport system substrate-binding protein